MYYLPVFIQQFQISHYTALREEAVEQTIYFIQEFFPTCFFGQN